MAHPPIQAGRVLMVLVHRTTVVAGVALFLLAGCSTAPDVAAGSASPTEAVAAFMHALGAKNSDAACAQVSTAGQPLTNAGFDQCKEGLEKVLADLNDPDEIQNDIDLVKLNGRWYIDSKQ